MSVCSSCPYKTSLPPCPSFMTILPVVWNLVSPTSCPKQLWVDGYSKLGTHVLGGRGEEGCELQLNLRGWHSKGGCLPLGLGLVYRCTPPLGTWRPPCLLTTPPHFRFPLPQEVHCQNGRSLSSTASEYQLQRAKVFQCLQVVYVLLAAAPIPVLLFFTILVPIRAIGIILFRWKEAVMASNVNGWYWTCTLTTV
jgi:hypothetical protein